MGRLRRLCGNYSDNNATSWLHLASWNLPDSQLNWQKRAQVFILGWGHCSFVIQSTNMGGGHSTIQMTSVLRVGGRVIGWSGGWSCGWSGGWFFRKIMPLRGSILQVGTCQILSLAENPRWSRVCQLSKAN